MINFNKVVIYFLLLSSLVFLFACSNADAEQDNNSPVISKAKKAIKDFNLTTTSISCLKFNLLDEKFDGKVMVDIREKHSDGCSGDPKTSPRLFSIGFEESTGQIWSDAKSLLGQLEKLK